MRKIVIALVVVLILAVLARIVDGSSRKQPAAVRSTTTTSVTQPPTTIPEEVSTTVVTSTSMPAVSQPDPSQGDSGLQDAIDAAATSTDLLATAQFLPREQISEIVKQLVVPEQQAAMESVLATSGAMLAKGLGYKSLAEASQNSYYNVQTMKYRVDKFENGQATISMFVITHWLLPDGRKEVRRPAINVVQMRFVDNTWRYVSAGDPPPGQSPVPKPDLTFEQTMERFEPYLREYQDYATIRQ